MTAAVSQVERPRGRGRQPAAVEARTDARDELTAHNAEALAFCDAVWPLVSRLELAAQHLGPVTHQVALALIARLASYERRHLPDGDPMALEAIA